MTKHLPVVLNQPFKAPPDSVLGRAVVAGDAHLGEILAAVARLNALNRTIAEVRAELAALRLHNIQPATRLAFTVGSDLEASSGKSALELCWETYERVQYLNRRIALYQAPRERIERSGKF